MKSSRVRIVTLGCKVNQCDSDEIARALAARGYEIVGERGEADVYIVNTCTVTATADAKARKLIRRLARGRPGAMIIATGCLAQRDPGALLDLPGVTAVAPKTCKLQLPDFLPGLLAPMFPSTYLPSRTRFFLKIQDGCDHRCAYCAVPGARGRPASSPFAEVMAGMERAAQAGAQELVLCGIRLGAYGRDGGESGLPAVLRAARALPIPRLRLSSIEPQDLADCILAEMADHPTLCHHLHLPLQSGDAATLEAMNRGYTPAGYADLVGRVRAAWPEAAVTTDVMVGFPGESDEAFDRSVDFVREMGFSRVHVFPFSARPETPAAALDDQVPVVVKRRRAERMLALAAETASAAAARWVGRQVSALFEERARSGLLTGLTPHYVRVFAPGPADWIGRVVAVTPTRQERGNLYLV